MGSQGDRQQFQLQNSARQGSVYGLTLDEVQEQLGEPLHGMNLVELLRNVLPAEGDRSLVVDLGNPSAHLANCSLRAPPEGQGSSSGLSNRTVDDVWRDIRQAEDSSCGNDERSARKSRPTLGVMTLEDFLVKAGVVSGGFNKRRCDMIGNQMEEARGYPPGVHWLRQHHQLSPLQQQQQQQQQQAQQSMVGAYAPQLQVVGVGRVWDAGFPDTQVATSSPVMGNLSDSQAPWRKRVAPGEIAEKTVERRQKRMIKNRESAARSRARKQAYTNELENTISRLEEENEMLKKQKELDKLLYDAPLPVPKSRHRRTSSNPF